MHAAPASKGRKANRFDERPHGARRIGVAQQDAVDARRQHLLEHPCVRADAGFVGAVHRHVHDHRGRPVPALGRSATGQPAHVVGETLDVEGRVLHVVADVVGPGLRVLHALLEVAVRPLVRARVVDRLALREQLDRAVDPLRFRCVGEEAGRQRQRRTR